MEAQAGIVKLQMTKYRKLCTVCSKIKIFNVNIQDEFALINPTRGELGGHMKSSHTLDLTLVQLQPIYRDKFTYLQSSRNLMVSLTDINARLASIQTGITCIQIDVDKFTPI